MDRRYLEIVAVGHDQVRHELRLAIDPGDPARTDLVRAATRAVTQAGETLATRIELVPIDRLHPAPDGQCNIDGLISMEVARPGPTALVPSALLAELDAGHVVHIVLREGGAGSTRWLKAGARGGFSSAEEVELALRAWIEAYARDMLQARGRRELEAMLARPARIEAHRLWELLNELQQLRIARRLGMTRRSVTHALLSETAYCQLDHGRAVILGTELAAVRANPHPAGVGLDAAQREQLLQLLSPRARRGYEQAVTARSLPQELADIALIRGVDITLEERVGLAGSARQRSTLEGRNAWLQLMKDFPCGDPPA